LKRLLFEAGNFDMIFYQGGVDVLGGDRLGRMNLTQEGVRRRNMMVYRFADQMDAMLIITMGGGYPASNDWDPIISAHAGVYLDAYSYLCNR
jgi:acetoin utilization deacetylase AcuC-like enzyme